MKILLILFPVYMLFLQSCSKDFSPTYTESDIKNYAQGYWEAVSGDINLKISEESIIIYNWYAIETSSKSDSVIVTWDDGKTCTKSTAFIEGEIIKFSAQGFDVQIKIEMNNGANASFKSLEKSYSKKLNKVRNDPTVLCL